MKRWIAIGAAAIAVLGGVGVASASGVTAARTNQPAGPHVRPATMPAAVDSAVEAKFTPIAPCRIVDTRSAGGAIGPLHTRSFHALGSGNFTGQGGSSCDIPQSAVAISASVLTVNPSATGYLKIWSYGTAEPVSSFTNYAHHGVVGKSGEIQVAASTYDFTVKASGGKTNVVVDVTGYYIKPMWAEIGSTGNYIHGSRVASLSKLGTGSYQVDFDRDVTGCAYTATSYFYGTSMEVEPRSGDARGVYVGASDYNGTATDTYFYLTVTC